MIHVYVYVYVWVCVCMCMCMCTRICTYVCIYTSYENCTWMASFCSITANSKSRWPQEKEGDFGVSLACFRCVSRASGVVPRCLWIWCTVMQSIRGALKGEKDIETKTNKTSPCTGYISAYDSSAVLIVIQICNEGITKLLTSADITMDK